MSSQDHENPPISDVLRLRGHTDFIDSFRSILRSKNETALGNVSKELGNIGLDHIAFAFVKGVRVDMLCYKCNKRLENIDELCYCSDAEEKCHHRNCCSLRGNRALTFY